MTLIAFRQLPTEEELTTAISDAQPGNLFPSGVGFNAARSDHDRFVHSVRALAERGLEVRPVQFARAPKVDRSTRPAADVPATDQLIYAAVVNRLKSQLYPGLVAFTG